MPPTRTPSSIGLINTSGTVVGAYTYDRYDAYATTTSTGSAAGLNPYRTADGARRLTGPKVTRDRHTPPQRT